MVGPRMFVCGYGLHTTLPALPARVRTEPDGGLADGVDEMLASCARTSRPEPT